MKIILSLARVRLKRKWMEKNKGKKSTNTDTLTFLS
jgi:hypothetical protein